MLLCSRVGKRLFCGNSVLVENMLLPPWVDVGKRPLCGKRLLEKRPDCGRSVLGNSPLVGSRLLGKRLLCGNRLLEKRPDWGRSEFGNSPLVGSRPLGKRLLCGKRLFENSPPWENRPPVDGVNRPPPDRPPPAGDRPWAETTSVVAARPTAAAAAEVISRIRGPALTAHPTLLARLTRRSGC